MLFLGTRDRYHTDPSGTFVRYDAKAIGSGSEAAQSELQDKWHKVSPFFPVSGLHRG
jgi:20S proteasome alpha/beta subunit